MQQFTSPDNWKSERPYSAGIIAGGLAFLSGHVPVDERGGTLGTDAAAQCSAVLANLERTLEAAGLDRGTVVSTTVYLTDMADIGALDEAYREFFGTDGPYPSRTTVQISSLGRAEFRVEISAIAVSEQAG